MNTDTLFQQWGLRENPFRADEAKDDPVFRRLMGEGIPHPDFEKIFGQPDVPSPAVVFGEKGSGKTALRLMTRERLKRYNEEHPDQQILVISYDDLNPFLDQFTRRTKKQQRRAGALQRFRLEDHMDGILSVAITGLLDGLLDDLSSKSKGELRKTRKALRKMGAQRRYDLAEIAILYDNPAHATVEERWQQLRKLLKLGRFSRQSVTLTGGILMTILGLVFAAAIWGFGIQNWEAYTGLGISALAAGALLGSWAWRGVKLMRLARKIHQEVHVVDRTWKQLVGMFGDFPPNVLHNQPLPVPASDDSRYQLFSRLRGVLSCIGYQGVVVLIDRVDEPTLIKGDPEKMKNIIWPLLDNKFLQQQQIGVKMLLPIELKHLLRREDAAFFQKARLDKQHMIEQLTWSGSTLYDLCNKRLKACRAEGAAEIELRDLFAEDVSREDLFDALEQMHQPRDAFKLLYQVIQEHCLQTPEAEAERPIPRLTLEHVRRQQSQRVQDLHRGLTPA